MKKKSSDLKSKVHKMTRKANLIMEMGEDIMDIFVKAKRYKRMK